MNNAEKLKVNKAAAEMLGHSPYKAQKILPSQMLTAKRIWIDTGESEHWIESTSFDIFPSTPQAACDREQVVIALGEKHGISIYYLNDNCEPIIPMGWSWIDRVTEDGNFEEGFKTYQEAIAAAVLSVSEADNV